MSTPIEDNDIKVRMARSRLKRWQCPECGGSSTGFLPDPDCQVCEGKQLSRANLDALQKHLDEKYPP
jgi:rubrerythrin